MTPFAIDTNLLVYAHNTASEFHEKAKSFLEKVMNERDAEGHLSVCVPVQVLLEFIHVMTWQRLQNPLSLSQAIRVVEDYVDGGIPIVHQRETQLHTFLELLSATTTRKKIFDIALAATLKDNGIAGLYTANAADFEDFEFLEVINPLQLQ
ncbi:MAG TPA: PIN domain-containing protein [Anaerolineae bacterium]|nr:PIN domain-containing protein [Anaerolineae bacterium]